jgi:His/Glu/Gln/Arg/opine family amino acid ABC transporter permease subunit
MQWELLFNSAFWTPFLDVGTWRFLGEGLRITVMLAAIVILTALVLATAMAIARISSRAALRRTVDTYAAFIRSMPLLVILFAAYFILPRVGLSLTAFNAAAIGLTIYFSAILSDVLKAGLKSVERGQWEAATSTGLPRWTVLRIVVMPQAFRRMLPAMVNVGVQCIKDTSLASIVTLVELTARGQQLQSYYANPLQTYIMVGLVYLAINLVLSRGVARLERAQ